MKQWKNVVAIARWFKDELVRGRFIDVAAASAMWLFLSLLPIAAVGGMIVAKIGIADTSIVQAMLAAIPPSSRKLLGDELSKVAAWNGGAVAPLSAIVFVWLASSGVHALFDSFEVLAGCSRSWLRKRAIAIGVCVGLSLWIACAGAVAFRFSIVQHALANGALRYVVGFGIEALLILLLFSVGVPRRGKSSIRRVVPGAILAAAIHAVLGAGYVVWVRRMGDGGAYQAGLATIGVTLMMLWLFALSLLIGLSLDKYLSIEVDDEVSSDSARSARRSSSRDHRPLRPRSTARSSARRR